MEKLRAYLNALSPDDQAAFARRCGTTIGYLRKALSKGSQLGEGLCIDLERESGAAIRVEDLRPEGVDWAYIRSTGPVGAAGVAHA